MKVRILFNGFRHGHVNALYNVVASSSVAEVAGCIEQNAAAREAATAAIGAQFSDKSYDEWLKDDSIDAVAIGGAYGERGAAVIKALKAGKHVIADKPLCISLEDLEEIRALTKSTGCKVGCMLDLRYFPQYVKAEEIIKSGRLGEVRNVSFNGQHCVDYAKRPSWYFEEGMHGGTINDLSVHGIDLVRMITGLDFDKIDAARTWNSYAYKHEYFKDCALIMARLTNGAGVLADVSYSAPTQAFNLPSYWEFRFWCEKGMLVTSLNNSSVTIFEEGTKEPIVIESEPVGYDYVTEFVDEVLAGTNTVTERVLRSTEICLTLQKAAIVD